MTNFLDTLQTRIKEGTERVKKTSLKEFFLPTSEKAKAFLNPAIGIMAPVESALAAIIRKNQENKSFKQRFVEETMRGGDITGALESIGMKPGFAIPLGIAASVALPGMGEASQLKKGKVLLDENVARRVSDL